MLAFYNVEKYQKYTFLHKTQEILSISAWAIIPWLFTGEWRFTASSSACLGLSTPAGAGGHLDRITISPETNALKTPGFNFLKGDSHSAPEQLVWRKYGYTECTLRKVMLIHTFLWYKWELCYNFSKNTIHKSEIWSCNLWLSQDR